MGTGVQEKKKLLNRLRRLRGQIEAIEKAVHKEEDCARLLQQATACRGALDGFIAKIVEDHVRAALEGAASGREERRAKAADDIVELFRSYII